MRKHSESTRRPRWRQYRYDGLEIEFSTWTSEYRDKITRHSRCLVKVVLFENDNDWNGDLQNRDDTAFDKTHHSDTTVPDLWLWDHVAQRPNDNYYTIIFTVGVWLLKYSFDFSFKRDILLDSV